MRPFFVFSLVLLGVCFSQSASACRAEFMEDTLFFKAVPDIIASHADTIADVVILEAPYPGAGGENAVSEFLRSKNEKAKFTDVATARITRVMKGNVRVGDVVYLQYPASSCGPNVTAYDPQAFEKRKRDEERMKAEAAAIGEPFVVDGLFSRSTSSGMIAATLSGEKGLPGGSKLLYPFAIRKSAEGKANFSAGDIKYPYAP